MRQRQARFWVDYKGSPTRLKLAIGQTVNLSSGGPTDEGYHWRSEQYTFDGRAVICLDHVDARDCDGRMTRTIEVSCPFSKLSTGWHDTESGATFPQWQQQDYRQRDFSAEAMGY